MDSIALFSRGLEHPQLLRCELAQLFINLAGEHPGDLSDLDTMLPDDVRSLVDASVAGAPTTDDDWSNFLIVQGGCDADAITRAFRPGVMAIREFRDWSR